MRPSKLRLPLSTAATVSFPFCTASRDRLRQRTAVADAGGAAVADQVEFQLFEIRHEAGVVQIIGHDFRSRRETRLHPGLGLQPLLDRLLGEQTGRDHHRRIRGVGATGDGGDHHGAVLNGRLRSIGRDFGGLRRRSQSIEEILLHVRQIDAILRPLRTGHRRNHGRRDRVPACRNIPDRATPE